MALGEDECNEHALFNSAKRLASQTHSLECCTWMYELMHSTCRTLNRDLDDDELLISRAVGAEVDGWETDACSMMVAYEFWHLLRPVA